MKPIRLTVKIELPPVGTPEREELSRTTLGELLGLGPPRPTISPDRGPGPDPAPRASRDVRPHREPGDDDDEPQDVQADRETDRPGFPPVPADGRQLMGWLSKQPDRNMQRRATDRARARGYGTLLVKLGPDEAADIFNELTSKRRGTAGWGRR